MHLCYPASVVSHRRFSYPPRHRLRRCAAGLAVCLSFASALLGSVTAGCGDASGDETSGRRVSLRFKVEATPESTTAFYNAYGWSVQLSRALLSVGSQYFFEGEPNLAVHSLPVTPAPKTSLLWIGVREAQAHPGHYDPGAALGEVLNPGSAELVAGPAELAVGTGVSGWYRSARFTFGSPASGSFEDALGEHVAVAEGTAAKDGKTLHFVAAASRDQLLSADAQLPVVDGCVFGPVEVRADGVVTLTIDLRVWVDQIPFEQIAVPEGGAAATLEPGSVPHKAFLRGLQKADGYGFGFST